MSNQELESDSGKQDLSLLSEQQISAAIKQLGEHNPNLACELCKKGQWMVAPHLVACVPVNATTLHIVLGGSIYPQCLLICKHCGNTKYINAFALGVVKPIAK